MPYEKRANKGISDAHKKALRIFASETRPKPSQRVCAEWFLSKFGRPIDRTTVSRVLSSQYDYLDTGEAGIKTRKSTAQWPILDQALFEWQRRHINAGFPISGPLIRMKAVEYWKKIPVYAELPGPLFSDGWLTRFKKRHSIRYHTFHGEAASVPASIHDEMKPIKAICDQYQPDDIYNMDETGLFWRRMPNGGLSTDGHAGQKRDKTRITIAVATNATGSDRMPLWLIGTAKTPRALRGVNLRSIGCIWRWNNKAWMRHGIMGEWLRSFYRHIGKQRRVLLLLDNFSAHLLAINKAPPPSNIKVVFFPANATSVYQPLDQGIIQNLKHHYRKKWMLWKIGPLYKQVTTKLTYEGQEAMPLDEFLDPSDENIDVSDPDLSDIIADLSEDGLTSASDDQDEDYIFGPPPELLSDAKAISHMHEVMEWVQHKEGAMEENIRYMESLIGDFTRLQVDGRKQKTLDEMGFLLKRK
ncbi:CENP-B protein 2 -like protein [Penicillium subrubescens]|uniref:CENP-B protein 2-like protein n=2 Tax=Penicillium subrubescens TaxID=1316194 RepID=A0A1Q5UCZ8_9EURO|nr:CENP-B protein 2 -like protein [Penicillium subrubescens]